MDAESVTLVAWARMDELDEQGQQRNDDEVQGSAGAT